MRFGINRFEFKKIYRGKNANFGRHSLDYNILSSTEKYTSVAM